MAAVHTLYSLFACDVMAAMLVYRNNKIFLPLELTPFLCKLCEQIFICFGTNMAAMRSIYSIEWSVLIAKIFSSAYKFVFCSGQLLAKFKLLKHLPYSNSHKKLGWTVDCSYKPCFLYKKKTNLEGSNWL